MTVAVQSNRVEYTAAAGQTVFPYPFSIDAASEVMVIQNLLIKTLSVHYNLTGIGSPTGGTVVLTAGATANDALVLVRVLPYTQTSDYVPNQPFPANIHESDHDRLVKIAQQLKEITDRCLQLNVTKSHGISGLELPWPGSLVPLGGGRKIVGWNAPENQLELIELTTQTGLVGDVIPASLYANLPSPISAGRTRLLLDRDRSLWASNGTQWVSLTGEHTNVKMFGAVADGIVNDTAAIQAAVAALPDGGILFFPPGRYRITAAITITKGCRVRGSGAASIGDIQGGTLAGTQINVSTAGQTAFAVNTRGKVVFEHLTIDNPTAAANTIGISATGPDEDLFGALFPSLFHVSMRAVAVGFKVTKGIFIEVDSCMFWNTTSVAVEAACTTNSDQGDVRVTNSVFVGLGIGINLIQGGLYVAQCKFLGFTTQIACNLDAFNTSTGDCLISGNSMEGCTGNSILFLRTTGTFFFAWVVITGNEIFGNAPGYNCINIETNAPPAIAGGTITGNCLIGMQTCIALNGGTDFTITGNYFQAGNTSTIGISVDSDANNCHIGPNTFAQFTAAPIANGSISTFMTLPCPLPFTHLTAMADGSVVYCTDGLRTLPVTAGGTGCIAKRINGQWDGRSGANSAGSAIIPDGATGTTVVHNAGYTPGLSQFSVTLGNLPTNDIGFWYVHTITSTTFILSVRSHPGPSGANFVWQINP